MDGAVSRGRVPGHPAARDGQTGGNGQRRGAQPPLRSGGTRPQRVCLGYGGAGPGQLALAILAHAAGDRVALREWVRFREEVIRQLEMEQPFALTAADVAAFLAAGGSMRGR